MKKFLIDNKINVENLDDWCLSLEVFEWILKNIPFGSTVLELGSGKGTIELSKNYNVYSVEDDEKFANTLNVNNLIIAPKRNGWYDVDILKDNLPTDYSLLIIDGPKGSPNRVPILNNLSLFCLNTVIIVDDVHAKASMKIAIELSNKTGKKMEIISSHNKKAAVLL